MRRVSSLFGGIPRVLLEGSRGSVVMPLGKSFYAMLSIQTVKSLAK